MARSDRQSLQFWTPDVYGHWPPMLSPHESFCIWLDGFLANGQTELTEGQTRLVQGRLEALFNKRTLDLSCAPTIVSYPLTGCCSTAASFTPTPMLWSGQYITGGYSLAGQTISIPSLQYFGT